MVHQNAALSGNGADPAKTTYHTKQCERRHKYFPGTAGHRIVPVKNVCNWILIKSKCIKHFIPQSQLLMNLNQRVFENNEGKGENEGKVLV